MDSEKSLLEIIEEKQSELDSVTNSFEEYMISSKEVEKEFECMLEETETENKQLKIKYNQLEDKYNNMNEKVNTANQTIDKLQTNVMNLTTKLNELTADYKNLENENEDWIAKYRVLQSTEESLNLKLEANEENLIFVQSDLDILQITAQENERSNAEEILDLRIQLSKMEESWKESQHMCEQLQKKCQENGLVNAMNADSVHAEENEAAKVEIDELQRHIQQINYENQQLQSQMQQLNMNLFQSTQRISDLSESLENAKVECDKYQAETLVLKDANVKIMGSYQTLEAKYKKCRDDLERSWDDSNAEADAELEKYKQQTIALQNEHSRLIEQVSTLTSRYTEELANANVIREELEEEVLGLRQNLTNKNKELKAMVNKESQYKHCIDEQTLQLESMKAMVLQTTNELSDAQGTLLDSLENTVSELKDKLQETSTMNMELQEENKQKSMEVHILKDRFSVESRIRDEEWLEKMKEIQKQHAVERNELAMKYTKLSMQFEKLKKACPENTSLDADIDGYTGAMVATKHQDGFNTSNEICEYNTRHVSGRMSSGSVEHSVHKALESNSVDMLKGELMHMLDQYSYMKQNNVKLSQRLQTINGKIQVTCRIRPPNAQEIAEKNPICIEVIDDFEMACYDDRTGAWRAYGFDKVWSFENCVNTGYPITQSDVYLDIQPLVLSILDGYNACIFACGQTSSGKTYTMNGNTSFTNHHGTANNIYVHDSEYGISYRALHTLFETLHLKQIQAEKKVRAQQKQEKESRNVEDSWNWNPHVSINALFDEDGSNAENEHKNASKVIPDNLFYYEIKLSMLEIYNETIKDLLDLSNTQVDIRQGSDGSIGIPGLTNETVTSIQEAMMVFAKGISNRATGSTNMNHQSSRSHLILMIDVTTCVSGDVTSMRSGKLHLVDLAGSENITKSGVSGTALREAQYINKSLSALGDVMEALDKKSKHIPYRNSKLTYLLQDSLNGSNKTMMIATICPTEKNIEDTLFTLQFATRIRKLSVGKHAKKNFNLKNLEESLRLCRQDLKDKKKKLSEYEELVKEYDSKIEILKHKKEVAVQHEHVGNHIKVSAPISNHPNQINTVGLHTPSTASSKLKRLNVELSRKQKDVVMLNTQASKEFDHLNANIKQIKERMHQLDHERDYLALVLRREEQGYHSLKQQNAKANVNSKVVKVPVLISNANSQQSSTNSSPQSSPPSGSKANVNRFSTTATSQSHSESYEHMDEEPHDLSSRLLNSGMIGNNVDALYEGAGILDMNASGNSEHSASSRGSIGTIGNTMDSNASSSSHMKTVDFDIPLEFKHTNFIERDTADTIRNTNTNAITSVENHQKRDYASTGVTQPPISNMHASAYANSNTEAYVKLKLQSAIEQRITPAKKPKVGVSTPVMYHQIGTSKSRSATPTMKTGFTSATNSRNNSRSNTPTEKPAYQSVGTTFSKYGSSGTSTTKSTNSSPYLSKRSQEAAMKHQERMRRKSNPK